MASSGQILTQARRAGFKASSALPVGELLSTLAAAKPHGQFLELGTGVGLGTAHILDGMSAMARLVTVELDPALSGIAQQEIQDERVEFVVADAGAWLELQDAGERQFDLVFADTWPGKFTHLKRALSLVTIGGFYVVDDLLPQPNWPTEHRASVDALIAQLSAIDGWKTFSMDYATGVIICSKTPDSGRGSTE